MRRAATFAVLLLVTVAGVILSRTSSQNPHGELKWDCQDCHTADSWSALRSPVQFNHDVTGFSLTGAHATAQCIGCHKDPVFNHVGVACADCHADHHQGQLGLACQNCHTPRDWQNRKDMLELHSQKGFALTGMHAVADCEACHRNQARNEYGGTPMDCMGCHAETYAATTDPNHVAAGFQSNCEQCHHAASGTWKNASYTHPSSFVLTGAHQQVNCMSCHAASFAGTPNDCYSCHSPDFLATSDPNHSQSGFTHECAICHTTAQWRPANYNHAATGFPLTGRHQTVACGDCHATSYAGTPTDCYSCHQTAFAGTTNPNHASANFSHDCISCHSTNGWTPSSFDHNTTAFPLTGRHTTVTCIDCHATGYAGTSSDCYSCHQTAFEGVSSPNHVSFGFSHDCTVCHSTNAWIPSSFDHNATAFPLTGKHRTVTCTDCHTTGYAGTPSDCYTCHQTAFEGVSNPNHVASGFSHDCTTCHSTSAWTPANFNHSATAFPLTGAHQTVSCIDCHTTGYTGTPSDCYTCHQTAFNGTTNPNHVTSGFSHDCVSCHSTTAWTPATFDHNLTGFPLTGQHALTACLACHTSGYTGTPSTCYACHQADYTGTTNPNHLAANFPTDCQSCHTTNGWSPANWDHDAQYFPIYSGAHNGKWTLCSECHVNPANFAVFECINCHEHNQTTMDAKHSGVSNYQYLSAACYNCHPRGRH
ncbi:MAG: cytochrome c3 family protein [Candidatus Zixiibacteriota bacterium]